MMTKKDFQLFAEMIAKTSQEEQEKLICWICPILRLSNYRFDEQKFREFIKRRIKGTSLKGLNCNPKYLYA